MNQDFVDVIEDGGIQRKVIEEGKGQIAYDQCRVKLYLKGWVEDGVEFECNYDDPKPKKYRVECGLKSQGLNQGLYGMKKGEKAIIRIQSKYGFGEFGDRQRRVQPGATLLYEVRMVELKPPKKKRFQMSVQEKNQKALKFRGYGSKSFKDGDYEEAKKHYKTASEYVQPDNQEAKELQASVYLNQSIVSYTLEEYKDSIDFAKKALAVNSNVPQKVKAHYRCAQAYKQIGELEKAEAQLKDGLLLESNNQLLIEELQKIKQQIKEQDKQARQQFAGMFERNVFMYEDKISKAQGQVEQNQNIKQDDQEDEVDVEEIQQTKEAQKEDDKLVDETQQNQQSVNQNEPEEIQEIQNQTAQTRNDENLETQASDSVILQDESENRKEKQME